MVVLCKDCFSISFESFIGDEPFADRKCPNCFSVRVVHHDELDTLSIAHIDCDAFYASVEKRDDSSLLGKPVIVGGGHRGVVAACCYVARISGVKSAMPMFEALKLCPQAVVIPPNMRKYRATGLKIRELMLNVTPIVEPVSIDEAFLDMSGTNQVHKASPAETLAKLAKRIETEVGITVSIGLSYNKFLAKIASDINKPRGFSVLGEKDANSFLENQPVGIIWGVGKSLQKKLKRDGIDTIGALRKIDLMELVSRYGVIGRRLAAFSIGIDDRSVNLDTVIKSVSSETTFSQDLKEARDLEKRLWLQAEKVSKRLKIKKLVCSGVTLKLRQSNFKIITRSRNFSYFTDMAEEIYRHTLYMLTKEIDGRSFRLLGIGAIKLSAKKNELCTRTLDLDQDKLVRIEQAMDKVRGRFGDKSIIKGRAL